VSTVWIIDDEPAICWALRKNLELERHRVEVFSSAEMATKRLGLSDAPDVLMLDVRLPGMDGLTLLESLRRSHPELAVIMMTAFGDLESAVKAVRGGAFEYLTKPFNLEDALATVRRAIHQKLLQSQARETRSPDPFQSELLLGKSPAMQSVFKQIAIAAKTDSTVLLEGEEGTGKSLVATMIHRFSQRHDQPFLPTSSTVDNDSELEAEWFGAISHREPTVQPIRTGLLELARGGTVLIDEVGAISFGLQIKLLHALESKTFHRMGDSIAQPLHCRVLFTSVPTLEKLVAEGEVDRRLAAHLEVFRIQLPPLRQRKEDIATMVRVFLQSRSVDQPLQITPRALEELERRDWLGNVRELKQTLERAAIRATGSMIQLEDLPGEKVGPQHQLSRSFRQTGLEDAVAQWASERLSQDAMRPLATTETSEWTGTLYEDCLNVIEPPLLRSVLEFHHNNRAAAATHLGLHRSTLRQKMRRYDIE
jgi:DNA-binding NtrC family response regulator